jgi:glycosidase
VKRLTGLGAALGAALTAALLLTAPLAARAQPLKLHIPSPDWRDQVIYFVMTDRFADGNPRNNDQGAGEYDPTRGDRYNGGDLQGLTERLAYIQGLGATALWLTPPVRNQWFDPLLGYHGYHGYWAQHFKQVDPHLGTLADYRRLSDALHRRGMYLVQDIVVNHVGNYFDYAGGFDAADPTRFYVPNTKSRPTAAPTQWPFSLNDPRRARDRAAATYHWTPPLVDTTDPERERRFQMSGLDDLNTTNPRVRAALRDSFGFWIREAGIDAFRVDTAFYVEPEFFDDFMHAKDRAAPGMVEAARRTGRRDFFVFGEGFGIDKPGEEHLARRIETYATAPSGRARMGGMLNFPLYGALVDSFARGAPAAVLGERIQRMQRVHRDIHRMVNFIDNHDVDRWLAGGSVASMKQALLAVMTLPGIPVLYYGTEQGFTEQRGAMFAAGFGSGGRDRFDTTAPLYRTTAEVVALRRAHRLFSRGTPRVLQAAAGAPGVLAWQTTHEGESALVVFNTSEQPLLVEGLQPRASAGARLLPLFGIDGLPPALRLPADGQLAFTLPARGAAVWRLLPDDAAVVVAGAAPPVIDALPFDAQAGTAGDFTITGSGAPNEMLRIVVDGDLARAGSVQADAQGRWRAPVDTRRMIDPTALHRVVALRGDGTALQASAAREFRATLPWRVLLDHADPEGDDLGPEGRYRYPTHVSFERGQMDIRHVRVEQAGAALRFTLTMKALSQVWGPPNGFDHVAFSVFIELPGRSGGEPQMAELDAPLPAAMRAHLRLRAHGWSNALFAQGQAVTPGASITTDATQRTVSFTIPAAALGDPVTLAGARLLITTWDYDGGFRAITPEGGPYTFGGAAGGPKWMDRVGPLTLP